MKLLNLASHIHIILLEKDELDVLRVLAHFLVGEVHPTSFSCTHLFWIDHARSSHQYEPFFNI